MYMSPPVYNKGEYKEEKEISHYYMRDNSCLTVVEWSEHIFRCARLLVGSSGEIFLDCDVRFLMQADH